MERVTPATARCAVLLLIGGLAACDDGLVDLNRNPNAPTDVPAAYIISAAMEEGVRLVLGSGLNKDLTSLWVQHLSRIEYAWNDRYEPQSNTINGWWNGLYAGPLTDLQAVIDKSEGRPNYEAVARILRSWIFHNITDLWGDVPYSEAIRGGEALTAPAYDPQSAIYDGLLADLEAAQSMIGPGPAFEEEDLIYGGDMEKWRRFANSLRLRIAMRLSEADPARAAAGVAAAISAGVFQSADDQAVFRWLDNEAKGNPWHSGVVENPGGFRISATIVDTMKALSDPRLPIYARPNAAGEYIGHQNGLDDGHGIPFPSRSMIGEAFVRRFDAPSYLMTYAEVLFLRAEAAQRGWIAGDPASLYHEAVREAMRLYGVSETEIDDYLAQPRVAFDPTTGLTQIALQKWLALFGQGNEAYAEWRRTGVPELVPGPFAATGNQVARRLPYPTEEQSLNQAHLQEAVARQGGAGLVNRVWWDQRP